MTATIRETNVFSDTFLALYGKLSTITDPIGKTKFIYHAFPDAIIDKIESYPLIVITSAETSYTPLTFKNLKRGPLRIVIDVYSTKADEMESLSNNVLDKLETSENDLQTSGIVTMRLINTTYGQFPRESFRIHNKSFNYEFDYGWY